jgi:competence protein ComEC
MPWSSFAFVRFALALMLGIGLGNHWPQTARTQSLVWGGLAVLALAYLVFWWRLPRAARRPHLGLGSLGLGGLILLGLGLTGARNERLRLTHFAQGPGPLAYYEAVLSSDVSEKPSTYRATAQVRRRSTDGRQWQPATGQVLLYLAKTDAQGRPVPRPTYGARLLVRGQPDTVPPPMNPHAFDYRGYLAKRQVYHQHYLPPTTYRGLGQAPPSRVMAAAIATKDWCVAQLQTYLASPLEAGLATALVLGVKDHLDNTLVEAYAATGTMHVLAVSGMHVALLFGLFAWLTRFNHWPARSKRKIALAVVALGLLWFYAFVTGLSASVLRAVVMFSFLLVGQTWGRANNIYNTLGLSAFLLLLYDPFLLYDVGFQLSYLAVLGIAYLYPRLYHRWPIGNWLGRQLWMVSCASLAAQLATFPLSVYYFHQFPNYFWLANPPIIFLGTLALYACLVVLALAWWLAAAQLAGWVAKQVIAGLNLVTFSLENLPGALWDQLSITAAETWLIYLIIIALLAVWHTERKTWLHLAVAASAVLAVGQLGQWWQQRQQQWVAVYHTRQVANLAWISGPQATVWADSAFAQPPQLQFSALPHWQALGVPLEQARFRPLTDTAAGPATRPLAPGHRLWVVNGRALLWLTAPPRLAQAPELDVLVVGYPAVKRLSQLQGLRFKQLVLDATFKRYAAQRLQQEAQAAGLACHAVPLDGAWLLDLAAEPHTLPVPRQGQMGIIPR